MFEFFSERPTLFVVCLVSLADLLNACTNSDDKRPAYVDGAGGSGGSTAMNGGADSGNAGRSGSFNTSTSTSSTHSLPKTCSTNDDCALTQTCALLPGASTRGCYETCATVKDCGTGSQCITDRYGNSVCTWTCDRDNRQSCVEKETCHIESDSKKGGYCVFAGSQSEGAICGTLDRTCAPEFECVFPDLPLLGVPRCAERCSVSAEKSTANACDIGRCHSVSGDRGGCVVDCDPFAKNSCADGFVCEATIRVVNVDAETGQGEFSGQCVASGTLKAGAPCVGGDCAEGLTCGPVLNDYGITYRTCGAPCSTAHPCTVGVCSTLGLNASKQADHGTCQSSSCTHVGEDCSNTEWCAPSLNNPGLGVCVAPGPAGVDEACVSSADCDRGLRCDATTGLCRNIDI